MHGHVIGQQTHVMLHGVQRGSQQRGVVPVGRSGDRAERHAFAFGGNRPFCSLFASVNRAFAGDLAAAGRFGGPPVDSDVLEAQVALAGKALDAVRRAHWKAPMLPASSKAPAGRCTNVPRTSPRRKPRRCANLSGPAAGCGAPTNRRRHCVRCSPPT